MRLNLQHFARLHVYLEGLQHFRMQGSRSEYLNNC
jgi:hypothetical protein